MRSQSYMTRAMKSSDPRYLHILTKLGYGATPAPAPVIPAPLPDPPPVIEPPVDDDDEDEDEGTGGPPEDIPGQELRAAREEYERVTGKRPYHGWDVAELARRIADFKKANQES